MLAAAPSIGQLPPAVIEHSSARVRKTKRKQMIVSRSETVGVRRVLTLVNRPQTISQLCSQIQALVGRLDVLHEPAVNLTTAYYWRDQLSDWLDKGLRDNFDGTPFRAWDEERRQELLVWLSAQQRSADEQFANIGRWATNFLRAFAQRWCIPNPPT